MYAVLPKLKAKTPGDNEAPALEVWSVCTVQVNDISIEKLSITGFEAHTKSHTLP